MPPKPQVDMSDNALLARRALEAETTRRQARQRMLIASLNRHLKHMSRNDALTVVANYMNLDDLELMVVDIAAKKAKCGYVAP